MGLVAMAYLGGLHELACIILRPLGAVVIWFAFLEPALNVVDELHCVN